MDYVRKKRWVRYQHLKCKMYLRNDFRFQCAYCRMREQDTGSLLEDYFEKDHFTARSTKTDNLLDAYDNMIYACAKCNGTKSNKNMDLLLNPCKDNIFSGSNPHVINLGKHGNYRLVGNTEQGKQYIDSLQLNSKFYRELRERQEQADRGEQELRQLLNNLSDCFDIPAYVLQRLEALVCNNYLIQIDMQKNSAFRCGRSRAGRAFQEVLGILESLSVSYELLFAENDTDILLWIDEKQYRCEIVLNDKAEKPVRNIRIKKEQQKIWDLQAGNYGVLYYYMKTGSLEFYTIDEEKVRRKCIKDCFIMRRK